MLVGAATGAGAVGVILALAGVHSVLRTVLVLLFLVVAPSAAIAGLLSGFDRFARLLLACVAAVVLLTIVAMILLSAGLWSPIAELVVVAVITAGCLLAQRPAVRARVTAWMAPRWRALLRHVPARRTAVGGPAAGAAAGGEPGPAGAGRDGSGRDGSGRDGSGRDGSGRAGSGRAGSGRAGSGRAGSGPASGPEPAAEVTAAPPAIQDRA